MPFLTEDEPPRGVPLDVIPGVRRVVARNPGVMTYHGTNTYLIAQEDGLTILDPGPDDAQHVQDVLSAAHDQPIRRILLSHTHHDHRGATAALQAATGAPTYGYFRSASPLFTPDIPLHHGDAIGDLLALHTPGHASDHLAYVWNAPDTGTILFSADHVMSWSSSIVNPPDGDMQAYYASLNLLLARDEVAYLPGHGPVLWQPRALVAEMLAHRHRRETAILDALRTQPATIPDLAAALYAKQHPMLKMAAERNVLAHLLKLQAESMAVEADGVWSAVH